MVITISREYGSGGSEIGHKLADLLGIPCYDKSVTALTADISGFPAQTVADSEDKASMALDYSGYMYGYGMFSAKHFLPIYDQIFMAQSKAIVRLARQGDCVIVGRCAAEVLNKNGIPCLNVFVHAPIAERIARIRSRHDISEADARKFIRKNDKARANYHKKYAYTEWGKMQNYHMTVSSSIGIDKVVRMIAEAVK